MERQCGESGGRCRGGAAKQPEHEMHAGRTQELELER